MIWILMELPHNFLMEQFRVLQMEVSYFITSKYDYRVVYFLFSSRVTLCDLYRHGETLFLFPKSRTTKITLDSLLRGKITIRFEIKKFSKPFY